MLFYLQLMTCIDVPDRKIKASGPLRDKYQKSTQTLSFRVILSLCPGVGITGTGWGIYERSNGIYELHYVSQES